uniref:Uncharacterized protein n=1 Tax=Caenorhabditis japonica TaxID=281687 RepID=A0A8R1I572_CAEJA
MLFSGARSSANDTRNVRSQISNNQQSIKGHHSGAESPGYLQLYKVPPGDDISLQEFDEIAMERLKLLKNFENCKDSLQVHTKEFFDKFTSSVRDVKLIVTPGQGPLSPSDIAECWRRDNIGHFILRLAFCRTPENQKWLSQVEGEFLRFRLRHERPEVVNAALTACNFEIHQLSENEKSEIQHELLYGCCIRDIDFREKVFYRVNFLDAIELVRRGMVHLKKGFAYFPFDDLLSILVSKMKVTMQAAMAFFFATVLYRTVRFRAVLFRSKFYIATVLFRASFIPR